MQVVLRPLDNIAARYGNALAYLGQAGARTAMVRALNHEGNKGRTKVRRALSKQMRLPYGLMVKAVVGKQAWAGVGASGEGAKLEYVLKSRGGPISLKYYRAKETAKGLVSRAPGMEGPFPTAFLRGGPWPRTVGKAGPRQPKLAFGGHAKMREGKSRLPLSSGVMKGPAIPDEMVKGPSLAAFENIAPALERRVGHEIFRLLR